MNYSNKLNYVGKKIILFSFFILVFSVANSQTEILLEDYWESLKMIKVEVNSKKYNFLFDTGGGITMVSPEIITEIDKSTYGNYIGYRMSGEKVETTLCDSLIIKINGIDFFHPTVGVFDVMSLLPKEFKRIDGIISLKTFEKEKITLNLEENKLIVESNESFDHKINDMQIIESRFANGMSGNELNIFVAIPFNNRNWWFLFDTGNISKTIISTKIAQEWGLNSSLENEKPEIEEFNFMLADSPISVPVTTDEIIYDGALSFDFISHYECAVSLPDEKIWIKKL